MKLRQRTLTVLFFALVLPCVAVAQVELQSTAEIEKVAQEADGSVVTSRAPAVKVVPGDEVFYTVHYRNTGSGPVDDVVITNPVPEHMHLLRTAGLRPGCTLVFSVDDGQSFDALSRLQITDANGRPRPATAADCTHLRWVFERQLEPGEAGAVSYVAQLL